MNTRRLVVIDATWHGQTKRIARRIADVAAYEGAESDWKAVEQFARALVAGQETRQERVAS